MSQRSLRLMAAPLYRGFIAREYGPGIRLPHQSAMYWHMEGRRFVRFLAWAYERKRKVVALHGG